MSASSDDPPTPQSGALFRPPPEAAGQFPAIANVEPVRVIGRGAWSTVWLARQLRPVVRDVAVKVLDPTTLGPEPLARFLREWDALARAAGAGVAALLDAGHTPDGRAYLVMEHVNGETITVACDRRSLPLRERLAVAAQLCDVIARVHARGLVHRDLKPSNILVHFESGQPAVTVLDFGLARISGPAKEESITQAGQPLGTPEWMAPEQTGLLHSDVDARADVYALGLLVERLWLGKPRWTRDWHAHAAPHDAMREALQGVADGRFAPRLPPTPAPTWDDLTPPEREELASLVSAATAPDPTARPKNAEQLAHSLAILSRGAADTPRATRRVAGWLGPLAVIGAAAAIVAGIWATRERSDSAPGATSIVELGHAVLWGRNDDGRCALPSDRTYRAIACGPAYTVAVDAEGHVVAAGSPNTRGAVIPAGMRDLDTPAMDVVAHENGGAALLADGRVLAWSDSATTEVLQSDVRAIAASRRSVICIDTHGRLSIFGNDPAGMDSPPVIPAFKSAVAAHKSAVGITEAGECVGWGSNASGVVTGVAGLKVAGAALTGYDSPSSAFLGILPDGHLIGVGAATSLVGLDSTVPWRARRVAGARGGAWFLVERHDGSVTTIGVPPAGVRAIPPLVSEPRPTGHAASAVSVSRFSAMSAGAEHVAVILAE